MELPSVCLLGKAITSLLACNRALLCQDPYILLESRTPACASAPSRNSVEFCLVHTKLVHSMFSKMLRNGAKCVCERNERCDNCLESFYELNGRFMDAVTGSNGKDIPERRGCSKSRGDHPVPKLVGVTTCIKRDGRSTNGIAVLRTY